jgi:VWFA-related protein
VAGLLAGQNPPPPVTDDGQTVIRTTARFVLVPVTVQDRSGNFVSGLVPEDFRLADNGKLQKITEDVASHPLSLAVVIQANADVEKMLPQIQKLASVFETLVIGANGEMAVVAFDHRIQTLAEFTTDMPKIDAAFKKLKPGSYSSNLNDALMGGINLLRNRPTDRRRVLVVIAENRDKGSQIKMREVLSAAEFANVVIYSVNVSELLATLTAKPQPNRPNPIPPEARHMPDGSVGTPTTDVQMEMGNWIPAIKDIFNAAKSVFLPDPLDVYPRYTGGKEYSFKTQRTLEREVSKIGEELHSQYLLTYSPNNQDEAGFHQIQVTVRRPDLQIRKRDGYYLAGKPE